MQPLVKPVSRAVSAVNLCKAYPLGGAELGVLKELSLEVAEGEFVSVCGSSGSGKTTLLNLISGIDQPSSGTMRVFEEELTEMNEDSLADFRCNKVGFIFQSYNLVSTLTAAENIAFPMEWKRVPPEVIGDRVTALLEMVSMLNRANHFPSQLSGGEQQRVAIGRALSNDPPLLLADEPTGNLDEMNRLKIVDVFKMLKTQGKTIIVSTHDAKLFDLADRLLELVDGRLTTRNE